MMAAFLDPQAWLSALAIFMMRVGDMSLDTIRVLFVVRGRKKLAWCLGILQSAIYVLAISSVLAHLDNPVNILGYAAGFATGNVVGMYIEERLAIGHIHVTIVSPARGAAVAAELREDGYAVTELSGRGRNGMVTVMLVDVLRKDVDSIETIVLESDPEAFVTAEDVRPVRRGFWRA
ncbi:MAG: DUF2179 domain-containing protein [Chloroflexi bacterium]|jgi:uncharacterized protein YebE (UPF0316 family)|nr:DUF5698 domain-containing protein [Anaerolineaceae bacterium]NMB91084.1 DUF2179 domain-containing protein [Chloroflexota bacterium]